MISESKAHAYCRDDISKIENYEKAVNDSTQTCVIHHRLELTLDGEFALTREQLKMHDMYYNRPYYELIFLTNSEHVSMHSKGKHSSAETREKMSNVHKGHIVSAETRKKISAANKGKPHPTGDNHPFYGKHHSNETKLKISESKKGMTAWNKGKRMSDESRRKLSVALSGENHPNYGKHLSEETRRKISEARKRHSAAKH